MAMSSEDELNDKTLKLLSSVPDDTMVNYMMSGVNRYCGNCLKAGEFLPLKFVMMNINSGLWMCPKSECIFPMASDTLNDYIEDNLTTEKVLLLTGKKSATDDTIFSQSSNVNKESAKTSINLSSSSDKDSMKTASVISKEDACSCNDNMSNSSTVSEIISTGSKKIISNCYPMWENKELLCWLDVILGIFMFNLTMKKFSKDETKNWVYRFYEHYKEIISVFRASGKYESVKESMDEFRYSVRCFLQPKMLSSFSEEDSPLLAIELITKTNKKVYEHMEIEYQSNFKCNNCDFERKDGFRKMILSLPNTPGDLNLSNNIYYTRPCYKCGDGGQQSRYTIEKYPESVFVYFEQGIKRGGKFWKRMEFVVQPPEPSSPSTTSPTSPSQKYIVTQIVQYISRRKHFVLWAYSYEEKLWIEADDLKEPVVRGKYKYPKCKAREVHLMVWEKVSVLEAHCLNKKKGEGSTDSLFGTQVDSPSLSNALPGRISGVSSRAASLASCDGVSPVVTPTGSVVDIPPVEKETSAIAKHQLKLQGSLKARYLHIPHYKPYVRRSKQPATSSTTPTNNNNNTSSLAPTFVNANLEDKTKTANEILTNDHHEESTSGHEHRPLCNVEGILDQLNDLPLVMTDNNYGKATTSLNPSGIELNDLSIVMGQELDEFYLKMLKQNQLEEISSSIANDTNHIGSNITQFVNCENSVIDNGTGNAPGTSMMNTDNASENSTMDIIASDGDVGEVIANSDSHKGDIFMMNGFGDLVDFKIDGVNTVDEIKISDQELDEIING